MCMLTDLSTNLNEEGEAYDPIDFMVNESESNLADAIIKKTEEKKEDDDNTSSKLTTLTELKGDTESTKEETVVDLMKDIKFILSGKLL